MAPVKGGPAQMSIRKMSAPMSARTFACMSVRAARQLESAVRGGRGSGVTTMRVDFFVGVRVGMCVSVPTDAHQAWSDAPLEKLSSRRF